MDFELLKDFPDSLANEWNTILKDCASHVPFLRYEYLKAWWQTRGGGEWPEASLAIVTARRDGILVGIAPLFLSEWQGRRTLLLLGSIEISDFLDLIAAPEDLDGFCIGLFRFLKEQDLEWQALDFYNILDSSPSLAALEKAAAGEGWQYRSEVLQHSPYIPLPGDWETYLAGIDKKQRHEIRRKIRRAEEHNQPVIWHTVGDADMLDGDIEDLFRLMAHDTEKAAFLTAPMRDAMRDIIRCFFETGCLHLTFLEIGDERVAVYLCIDYLNRLWVYNSGIDPQFRELSPGWVLLAELLRWANEEGRIEFDFMRGDEDYKYRFGGIDRFVMRATIERN